MSSSGGANGSRECAPDDLRDGELSPDLSPMEAGGGVCKGAATRVFAKRGAADLIPDRFTLRRLARAGFRQCIWSYASARKWSKLSIRMRPRRGYSMSVTM